MSRRFTHSVYFASELRMRTAGAQVGRGHHWFPRRPCVARRRYPAAACRTGSCPLDHQRVQINQMTNPIRYGVHDAVDRQPAKRMADEHPPISWALPPLLCNVDLRSLVLTSNRRIWKCGFRACPGMTETAGAAGGKGSLRPPQSPVSFIRSLVVEMVIR